MQRLIGHSRMSAEGLQAQNHWARSTGYALAAVLAALGALQAYWALGGRWGLEAALGEGNPVPPPAAVWAVAAALILAALTVLGRVGVWGRSLPPWMFVSGTWALCLVLAGVALLNLSSGRLWEMLLIAPFCGLLAALTAAVARAR